MYVRRSDVIELVKESYYNLAESMEDVWAMLEDVEKLPSVCPNGFAGVSHVDISFYTHQIILVVIVRMVTSIYLRRSMMKELVNKQDIIDILMKRSDELIGIYGDLGGAMSGVVKLLSELPPETELEPCDFCKHKDDCGYMAIYCPSERRTDE